MAKRWQDELAESIAAMMSKDWSHDVTVIPGHIQGGETAVAVPMASFVFEVKPFEPWCVHGLLGAVNDREFAGAEKGCLLFTEFDTPFSCADFRPARSRRAKLGFCLKKRPWNQLLDRDGTWHEYRDAVGEPLYREADFDLIP